MRKTSGVLGMFGLSAGLAAFAWLVGFVTALDTAPPAMPIPSDVRAPENFALFNEVWRIIDAEYYWDDRADAEVTYASIEGALASLEDPYADFLSAEEATDLQIDAPPVIEGIGAWVEPGYNGALVLATIPDSPADRAGVKAGDTILAAGDNDLQGRSRSEVLDQLNGPPGTSVVLTLLRDENLISVELVRDAVEVPGIQMRRVDDNVSYIKIGHFGPGVDAELRSALEDAATGAVSGLIIDLRDNPGGSMRVLRRAASHLVTGVLWQEVSRHSTKTVSSVPDIAAVDLGAVRLVLLVNEGTASASEIFAAILQEKASGTTVGTATFGKHTIQGVVRLGDGSFLKLTMAEWQTASGLSVADGGLEPDRVLGDDEDPLAVAVEVAGNRAARR